MFDLRCANLPARVPAVIPASLMGHPATRAAFNENLAPSQRDGYSFLSVGVSGGLVLGL
jgi:hypothetical protein